jgi:hypothetical protein
MNHLKKGISFLEAEFKPPPRHEEHVSSFYCFLPAYMDVLHFWLLVWFCGREVGLLLLP